MTELFILSILLYHMAEGRTEAWTWMGRTKGIDPKHYHFWRILEGIGIVGAIVVVTV